MPQLKALIEERHESTRVLEREGRICPWVFSELDGQMLGEHADAWESARRAAGVPGRLVHDLRRSAARNLIAAGVDEKTAQTVTGHKSRSMFDRYHIVAGADVADAMAKVGSRLKPMSGKAEVASPQ